MHPDCPFLQIAKHKYYDYEKEFEIVGDTRYGIVRKHISIIVVAYEPLRQAPRKKGASFLFQPPFAFANGRQKPHPHTPNGVYLPAAITRLKK